MGMRVHVPDVRHALFFQVVVDALADADQAVLVAAAEPQQLQFLLGGRRIGHELGPGLVFGAEEKPPTQAKISDVERPMFKDWPPPMDRPAKARCSASVYTE